jgi:hypothetical protein
LLLLQVFKGTWRGTVVAVKIMILPSYMTGKEKRERMAIMETAISSSLSHPNVVQVSPASSAVVAVVAEAAFATESTTWWQLDPTTAGPPADTCWHLLAPAGTC